MPKPTHEASPDGDPSSPVLSRDEIVVTVRRCVAEVLNLSPEIVAEDSRFASDLGGDHDDAVGLVAELENEFDVWIDGDLIDESREDELTVDEFVDAVVRALEEKQRALASGG
ncbi:MAG: phosphopantetheine-binding protein [Planctomycetota bacterium]